MQLQLFPTKPEIQYLQTERSKLQRALFAENTIMGYGYDWAMFEKWCNRMGRFALPASSETVGLYLTDLLSQGKKLTTARRRNCAIAHKHRMGGFESPVTAEVYRLLHAAQRMRGEKPRQMRALSVRELRAISAALLQDGRRVDIRDRAILVVGFASALRRSNIAALLLQDVEFTERGLVLSIQREKQDQEGRGRLIGIAPGKHPDTCPVQCLRDWLKHRGFTPGPLFTRMARSSAGPLDGDSITRIVKQRIGRIGLDATDYGAHSLRAGFVTEAAEAGASELLIAAQTGHHSMEVLRKYFRRRDLFKANASGMIGL